MTKQADYGIVLMAHLASHPGRRYAAPELAAEAKLPLPMVSKILKLLGQGGLLISHRGAKGGYSLALDPHEISVATLIAVLDGPIAFTECIENTPGVCSQEASCRLRGNWQLINHAIEHALARISLAQLISPLHPDLIQLGSGSDARVRLTS